MQKIQDIKEWVLSNHSGSLQLNQIQKCPRVASLYTHNMQGISLNKKDDSAFIWQVLSLAAAYVFLISADFWLYYYVSPTNVDNTKIGNLS